MSFYTSLSGLKASQTDMSVISHNIANSATNGFKKSKATFSDVMASSLSTDPTKQVGSGTVVQQNRQNFKEGNYNSTASALDLAISGDGFFAVNNGGNLSYTRNGAFQVDTNGMVTDAQGSNLQVYPVDQNGNVTATGTDGLIGLKLPETSGAPVATGKVTLDVNLSSSATVPKGPFNRTNATTYNNSTTTTIYDAAGNAQSVVNYYVRNEMPANSTTTSWSVYSFVGEQPLRSGGISPQPMTFDASGTMTLPTEAVKFDPFLPKGQATQQSFTLDYTGSTEISSVFSVDGRSQDGVAPGTLSGVSVDKYGLITASFSNGDTQALGKVAVANFNNPEGLRQDGNSYWSATGQSGKVKLGEANTSSNGAVMSSTLEGSNVDITEELVGLIAAQRNFQANAKALDTASQISQTIFNIRA